MSETAIQPAPDSAAPGSDPATTAGEGGPAATPAGFVPQGEAEAAREEARRARQAAEDLRQELTKLKAAPAAPAKADDSSGFDPDAYRQSLLRDVSGVIGLATTAQTVKSEFPHADPALFEPERMSQFSSPDAFRTAVEDSHKRVAAILDTGWADREKKLRDELAEKFGDTGGNAGGGGTPAAGGDPTVAQLLAMDNAQLDALEASNPGVLQRVKTAAGL